LKNQIWFELSCSCHHAEVNFLLNQTLPGKTKELWQRLSKRTSGSASASGWSSAGKKPREQGTRWASVKYDSCAKHDGLRWQFPISTDPRCTFSAVQSASYLQAFPLAFLAC